MSHAKDSTQMEFFQTSLPGDSPARTSAAQENRPVSMANDQDYGQNAPVFLGRFDPVTQSLKTSQLCLVETTGNGLSEFCGTYPRSGMMRSGTVYQLTTLAPLNIGIESGLWPTANAVDYKGASVDNSIQLKRQEKGRSNLRDYLARKGRWLYPPVRVVEFLMGYPIGHTDCED